MPEQGKKQSEETKKKISEALKKGGSEEKPMPKNPVARALFQQYEGSKMRTLSLREKRDALRAQKKELPRGRKGRAARKELSEQIKAIRAEMKKEVALRKEVRKKAKQERRKVRAAKRIKKAQARLQKLQSMEMKAKALLDRSKDPKRRKRYRERLERIALSRQKQNDLIKVSKSTIRNGGVKTPRKIPASFDFHDHVHLADRPQKPFWRGLTQWEEKVNLTMLNEQFNKIEGKLEQQLVAVGADVADEVTNRAEKVVKSEDLSLIEKVVLSVTLTRAISKIIKESATDAFWIGKKSAAQELRLKKRDTASIDGIKFRAAEAAVLAGFYAQEIAFSAKNTITNGIAANASPQDILVKVRENVAERINMFNVNLTGSIVGQNMNRGRREVFLKNINTITKFQRSEVLDSKTCNFCLSIDKRVVKGDNPLTALDLVHTHCRGLWVPVFSYEEQPKLNPFPKTVTDSLKTIGGKPVINGFKQIKKPIASGNPAALKVIGKKA